MSSKAREQKSKANNSNFSEQKCIFLLKSEDGHGCTNKLFCERGRVWILHH